MDQIRKKIITISFVALAFVAAIVGQVLLKSLAAAVGTIAKYYTMDIVRHGVPISIGIITFLVLTLHPRIKVWAEEVVLEITKIVWPSGKDTKAMTITCCIMVVVSGVILWFFDATSTAFVKMILDTNG